MGLNTCHLVSTSDRTLRGSILPPSDRRRRLGRRLRSFLFPRGARPPAGPVALRRPACSRPTPAARATVAPLPTAGTRHRLTAVVRDEAERPSAGERGVPESAGWR